MLPVTDPILMFTVLVTVILFGPLLARRLRLPDLVLLLAAGAVLGPKASGVLEHNTAIELFAEVGIVYIMFLAGLEIDLHRFARTRQRSIGFGLLTFAVPQVLGTLMGRHLLDMPWPAALLLASMFASHTLLAYPLASRLGLTRREPVVITVGATIITDTLALLVLAVIARQARGLDLGPWFWLAMAGGIMGLSSLAWWGIPWLSHRFFHRVREEGGAQFLFVIGTVCACAYLSHRIGLEPIIGGFLAGVAFNRLIPAQSALMSRVEFAGNSLFIPFFLVSVGMLVDPRVLVADLRSWQVAIAMVMAVVVTKWLAAWLASWRYGYRRDDTGVMFGLSVVQAAATLAAVRVGYDLDVLDDSVLNGAIIMIVVTCPLGSWAVDRYGRRLAAAASAAPACESAGQRLMVPVADPASLGPLLDLALLLRDHSRPGAIHPVAAVDDEGDTSVAVAQAEDLMARCMVHAAAQDAVIQPTISLGLNIGDTLVRTAKELRADTLLLGWSRESRLARRLFGTLRDHLLDACPARVVLCRLERPLNTTQRVLVPVPPMVATRPHVIVLLRETARLAQQIGAELVLHLSRPDDEAALGDVLKDSAQRVSIRKVVHDSWRSALASTSETIADDDVVVLAAERRYSPLWSPSLERLPEIMVRRWPEVNLLAVYPALPTPVDAAAMEVSTPAEAPDLFAHEPLIKAGDLVEAVDQMTRGMVAWDEVQRHQVSALLTRSAQSYPVELVPDVVLVHAHSEVVVTPTVLVAVGTGFWPLSDHGGQARIALALISPGDHPTQSHLSTLQLLTRCFRDPQRVAAIRSAENATVVAAVLADGMEAVVMGADARSPSS